MCSSLTTLQCVSILDNIHYSIRQHYSCILLSFWFVLFTNKNVIGILCWFETSLFMTSVIVFTLSCCHTSVITEIARHNLVTFKGTTVGAWIGTLRQNRIVYTLNKSLISSVDTCSWNQGNTAGSYSILFILNLYLLLLFCATLVQV